MAAGGAVAAGWTIANRGMGSANGSTTVVRVNQSATSASGTNAFTYSTPSLGAGATQPQDATITASTTAGTYYVWVITDNTGTAGQNAAGAANDIVLVGSFTVTGVATSPDLRVINGSVTPSSVNAGGSVTATWTIANQGTAVAGASQTVVRVNQSSTSAAGSNLFTYSVTSLPVNGTFAQGASIAAPAVAGTYYVWVITDNTGTAGQNAAAASNDIVRIGSFVRQ